MKKIKYVLGCFLASFILSGCAGSYMVKVPDNEIKSSEEQATIVFMRSSFVSSAIGVEMFEIEDSQLKFVGYLGNGTKIAHKTSAGEKVYMAFGAAADFMIANVKAGKTYYSIVRPNWGTGGFAPTPIRIDGTSNYNTDSPSFKKWVEQTRLYKTNEEEAEKWFIENKEKYQKFYDFYWPRFQTKSNAQIMERTLNPEDGL